jgi:hypothetical protein
VLLGVRGGDGGVAIRSGEKGPGVDDDAERSCGQRGGGRHGNGHLDDAG